MQLSDCPHINPQGEKVAESSSCARVGLLIVGRCRGWNHVFSCIFFNICEEAWNFHVVTWNFPIQLEECCQDQQFRVETIVIGWNWWNREFLHLQSFYCNDACELWRKRGWHRRQVSFWALFVSYESWNELICLTGSHIRRCTLRLNISTSLCWKLAIFIQLRCLNTETPRASQCSLFMAGLEVSKCS